MEPRKSFWTGSNTRTGRFWVGLEREVEVSSGYRQLTAVGKKFLDRVGRVDLVEKRLDLERKLR